MNLSSKKLVGKVKSRLLPLPVWESILEWLVECLPRYLIGVELQPVQDLEVINESKGEYRAVGYFPRFRMNLTPSQLQCGWYYLEAALMRNNGNRDANVLIEVTGEENNCITIPVPTNLRGTVREVFYIPARATALHWSPTAAPGFFSQSELLLHRITALESYLRRLYRVLYDLWRCRQRTPENRAGLTWSGAFMDVEAAYRRTAELRVQRLVGNDYATFIALHDMVKQSDISLMRKEVVQFPLRPVISLIMVVHSPKEQLYRETLDSVCSQVYPNWELLLVVDFTLENPADATTELYAGRNDKVRVVTTSNGGDISEMFNRGLKEARGQFVARINQHDRMPAHALYHLVQEINRHPDAELIYTDDDNIDEANKRSCPRFKPAWNADLFYSYNYLTHLVAFSRMRLLEIGGYRTGFQGAEEYDTALRFLKNIKKSNIRHIARVLYHQKIESQEKVCDTPADATESCSGGLIHASGKRALEDFFQGRGVLVEDGPAEGVYRIKYPLPKKLPLVSIIIPTRDKVDVLKSCVESILEKTEYTPFEILIIDNQSKETSTLDYLSVLALNEKVTIIQYNRPFNYSAINNFAVRCAKGEILALLNNDVEIITPGWLAEMVSHAQRPNVGAVGAKLLYSNGLVQHAGVIIGLGGVAGHAHRFLRDEALGYCHRAAVTQELSAVTGACLVVRKEVYAKVGGFDENNLAISLNDVDFCLKIKLLGYKNIYTPYAKLFHHESISRGYNDTKEKNIVFENEMSFMRNKWKTDCFVDDCYNINLTNNFENFCVKIN